MFKNISKVVLASFLFTGAAKAALIYDGDKNRYTVDVKAELYATHDWSGFKTTGGKNRTTGPVEFIGTLTVENFYTKKFNEDFSAMAYLKLKLPIMDYSGGAYGSSHADEYNTTLHTFSIIDKANLNLNHSYIGQFTIGRYKAFYDELTDFSDVDIFVGVPAHSTKSKVIFGGSTETGIAYKKSFINDILVLGVSFDGSKDSSPYEGKIKYLDSTGSKTLNYNLKKDFKVAGNAQFNITDDIKVGAVYNLTGFRVENSTTQINRMGRDLAQNIITGINYNNRGTNVGLTGSFQDYDFKVSDTVIYSQRAFGIQAGISYDFSRIEQGFRPSLQYDFKKGYTKVKNTTQVAASSINGSLYGKEDEEKDTPNDIPNDTPNDIPNTVAQNVYGNKEHTLDTHSVELGLSYYVNPSLYYVAAAVIDLRSKSDIAKADNIARNQVTKKHYFGIGVVYKF